MFYTFVLFTLGLLLWTFLEYGVHRWLFHGLLLKYHQHHHVSPKVPKPVPLWAYAFGLIPLFWISVPLALGVTAGLIVYEALHQSLHHEPPQWLDNWHVHHLLHHQHPTTNFGLTTNLWDWAFRTLKKPAV